MQEIISDVRDGTKRTITLKVTGSYCEDSSHAPGLGRKAWNYARAKAKHVAAGSPLCTKEQVGDRHAICRDCPSGKYHEFTDKERAKLPQALVQIAPVGICKSMGCGCFLHEELIQPNKLYWAEQECPHGHWPAIINDKENDNDSQA